MSKKGNARFAALSLLLATSIALTTAGQPAMAASTWMPNFDANQTVYVDPLLRADTVAPVDLSALPPKLAAEAAKNNLKVYLVMARKGDETTGNCKQKFAVCKMEELMGKWNAQLPQDDYVLLLVVRSDVDWTKVSYAVNLGNRPRGFGVGPQSLNLQRWATGADGGVAYLPRDPGGYALHVVQDINELMDKAASARRDEQSKQQFMADLPGYLMLGTGLLMAIGLGVFLALRYSKERTKAEAAIKKLKDALFNANGNYMEIQNAYLDFLSEQGNDWKTRFEGPTLVSYTEAVADYAALSARIAAANERMIEAESAFKAGNYFSVAGFQNAYTLLEETPVQVTGESLPLEVRGLFSSEVKEDSYTPGELLNNMEQLFSDTNRALAGIISAFSQANENAQKVTASASQIESLCEQLRTAGIGTEPYSLRLKNVLQASQNFEAKLQKDPLSASTASAQVCKDAASIVTDLQTALALSSDLGAAELSLQNALTKVAAQRAQIVNFNYAGSTPSGSTPSNYLLDEDGYNPDTMVARARSYFASALKALQEAQLEKATEQKQSGIDLVNELPTLLNQILEAQDFVSQTVASIASTRDKLSLEVEPASKALTSLQSDFLPVNYEAVKENAVRGLALASSTISRLEQIKVAYFEQRFMAAAQQLKAVRADIQQSRDGLAAIHDTLKNLHQLRSSAREINGHIQIQLTTIGARLKATAFTTSSATDSDFEQNANRAAQLAQQVALDKANWVQCDLTANEVRRALADVSRSIESQLAIYDCAVSELEATQSLYQQVEATVSEAEVRDQARQKLAEANRAKQSVEASMKIAKSDWKALSQSTSNVNQQLAAAQSLAKDDIRLANEAENAIDNASREIDGVSGSYSVNRSIGGSYQSFGFGISADTSSARSRLSSARNAYGAKNYEEAIRSAESSQSAAREAQREAERQVESQISAAVYIYEEEQRRIREAAAELQRQEDARQRQIDDDRRASERAAEASNSYSSDTSSSGSYGGSDTTDSGSFGGGDF